MNRFSDFSTEFQLEGDKIPIETVLNTDIIVENYKITDSKYKDGNGKLLTLQIQVNNNKNIIFTGSEVLKNQIEKYKEKLPFVAKIVKINNKYYSFN